MKKLIPYILICYFILQLLVPGYFVYRYYNTLYTGESYKFEVSLYDPYDPFRGRYLALSTVLPASEGNGEYALLVKDSQGYATVLGRSEQKPTAGQYVKNLQLDRYYMNEKMAVKAESLIRELDLKSGSMYLTVKVKNGYYVIQSLSIEDIPIEQYLK